MMPVTMVGRGTELSELGRAWSSVSACRRSTPAPVSAVITGAAGVGKSTLVAAALARFTPPPSVVLSGTARVHSPAPYDWLAAVLSGRDTNRLGLPADALAWLAQQPSAPRERYAPGALLRLAVQTVRLLVGAEPAVLVVEDLHALDPASLNLVGELATVPGLPVLLVVTSQPPAAAVVPELVARALARLTGVPGTVRQHLGPLDPTGVARVLAQVFTGAAPPTWLATAVWRRTGGNPYLLTELLAGCAGQGLAALTRQLSPADPGRSAGAEASAEQPSAGDTADASGAFGAELTVRETEVLGCLAAGMSNKEIARTLGISVRTVTVHVSNLLRKTGSTSRTAAALWAVAQRAPAPVSGN